MRKTHAGDLAAAVSFFNPKISKLCLDSLLKSTF